jgi:hypothetical protein
MRPRAELEHHRRQPQALDGVGGRRPLGCELAQGRAQEDAQALVRRADHRRRAI